MIFKLNSHSQVKQVVTGFLTSMYVHGRPRYGGGAHGMAKGCTGVAP